MITIRAWAEHEGTWDNQVFSSSCVVGVVILPDTATPREIEEAKIKVAKLALDDYSYITINDNRSDLNIPRFFIPSKKETARAA